MRRTWLCWHHCYSSVERPTEESRWLAVLERVAERLSRSSFVDLGTGTLWSSRYLLYFLMWLACVVSHLRREHNSSGFRVFLSSKTFGHKSCILVRFLSIICTYSEFTSLFISSSKHKSKVFTIQEKRTGQKRQNNIARLSWDCNGSSQWILFAKRSTWSCPWSETKNTPFGALLWMYFSSVNRSCFKLFLFSTVLL